MNQSDAQAYCMAMAARAREASQVLATAPGAAKDLWLQRSAEALIREKDRILSANARDVASAAQFGLSTAQVDRLRLTPSGIEAMARGLNAVAALPDPVGRILEGGVRPSGLEIRKVAVPLGVLFFIYESRPNVTVDAAALAVKSGNAIILRGGKEAVHSNVVLVEVVRETLRDVGLPGDAVQFVDRPERDLVGQFLGLSQFIDVAIPRGGEELIRTVARQAAMPVLKHYKGNCHVYVDVAADLAMAERIVVNAKCQRPGTCNAAESLLVHAGVAERFLPDVTAALRAAGVQLRGCSETRRIVADVDLATEEDFAAEYLDLIMSIKVVANVDAAIDHVARYGSRHTEAIITRNLDAARRFCARVDAAAVMVNASTRLHDGYEFGMGAEIGISTDKFHARGPCGLVELTSYKYVVVGDGHLRT